MTPAGLAEKLGATVSDGGAVVLAEGAHAELDGSPVVFDGRLDVQGKLTLRNGIYAFQSITVRGTLALENATLRVLVLSYSSASKIHATDSQVEPYLRDDIRLPSSIVSGADVDGSEQPPMEFRNVRIGSGMAITLYMTRESSQVRIEAGLVELGVPYGMLSEANDWSIDADEVRLGIAGSQLQTEAQAAPVFSRFPKMSIQADTVTVGAFPEDNAALWLEGIDALGIQGKTRAPSKLADGWLLGAAPGWRPDASGTGGTGKVVLSEPVQCDGAIEPTPGGGRALSGMGHPLNVTMDRSPPVDIVTARLSLSTGSGQVPLIEGNIVGNQFSVLTLPLPESVCIAAGAPPEAVTSWQLLLETSTQFGCARGETQDRTATIVMLPRVADGPYEACLTQLPSTARISR